jgi:hypothetical protein
MLIDAVNPKSAERYTDIFFFIFEKKDRTRYADLSYSNKQNTK